MSLSKLFHLSSANKDIPLLPLHASRDTTPYQTAPASPDMQQPLPSPKMTSSQPIPQSEPLLAVLRQESHLQSHLQYLLDAQSEGLLAGLTAPTQASSSSTGSRTPTTTISNSGFHFPPRSKEIVPIRQPPSTKPSLRAARRGITRTIASLASLKTTENQLLNTELNYRTEILSTIATLSDKTTGLQTQITTLSSSPPTQELATLETDSANLETSIKTLEIQLREMKFRHRTLLSQISDLENRTQSALSSYTHALTLAEKEARDFLSQPPLPSSSPTALTFPASSASISQAQAEGGGLWTLPPHRRTLDLAREHYITERRSLNTKLRATERERSALEAGKRVWEECVGEVTAVENTLRTETKKLLYPPARALSASDPHDEGDTEARNGGSGGMPNVLERIKTAEEKLEGYLDLAERKGWRLLVCAVGAELEALVEGRGVLEGVLGIADGGGGGSVMGRSGGEGSGGGGVGGDMGNGGESGEGEGAGHDVLGLREEEGKGGDDGRLGVVRYRDEEEDEGPGPELLISHDEG